MDLNEMVLVSVDDHVVEPPHLFEGRLPARYADLAPQFNMDHVMWECDYPHSDSTWPFAPEELVTNLDGVSDHDIDRVTHLNAMRHFSYDPFTALGRRESCTVGALRARAAGHDVSIRSTNAGKVGKHAARSVDLSVPGGS